jgi:choline dehydrogenase-like flavoprotein
MPFVSDETQRNAYDVVVVGSGAAGGQSAYTLCMDGARVLMLEAGRDYNPQTETAMLQTPESAPLRGTATDDKPAGYYDATVGGGWAVPGEPYVVAEGSEPFQWWRPRMLGGRTNLSDLLLKRLLPARAEITSKVASGNLLFTPPTA